MNPIDKNQEAIIRLQSAIALLQDLQSELENLMQASQLLYRATVDSDREVALYHKHNELTYRTLHYSYGAKIKNLEEQCQKHIAKELNNDA